MENREQDRIQIHKATGVANQGNHGGGKNRPTGEGHQGIMEEGKTQGTKTKYINILKVPTRFQQGALCFTHHCSKGQE